MKALKRFLSDINEIQTRHSNKALKANRRLTNNCLQVEVLINVYKDYPSNLTKKSVQNDNTKN